MRITSSREWLELRGEPRDAVGGHVDDACPTAVAVALDPDFSIAHAGLANVCVQHFYYFERDQRWIDRAIAASDKAGAKGSDAVAISSGAR